MKRLLLIIGIIVLVSSVQGLALDFQNPSDFSEHIWCTGTCAWFQNTSGGNSYVYPTTPSSTFSQTPLPMTYMAYSTTINYTTTGWLIYFYDGARSFMGVASISKVGPNYPLNRIEVKMVAGSPINATVWINGVERGYVDGFSQNPSYIGTSDSIVDDIIWGSTESRYIFGMPENGYFLMKDILNPAASGFYRVNTTNPNGTPTLIYSTLFPSTFGKNNGNNETVTLSSPSGGTQLTYSTGTAYAGTINWNLTQFFASDAPYGLYQTTINPQTDSPGFAASDYIPYIGSGAVINWDKNSYAIGETAKLSVEISDAYYNTDVYSYHVVIMDIFGTEISDHIISFTSSSPYTGSVDYTFTDDNEEGVYYGMIYATQLSDSEELLMSYDTADLTSNVIFSGYVFNAENATVISGAMVNVTQGSTTDALTTVTDGNYTSTSTFSANTPTTIVASKTGFEQYTHTFTPLYAGEFQINLTLMPTNPIHAGNAVGGIVRKPPYNLTIPSATVEVFNGTDYNSTTTNTVGYYLINNLTGSMEYTVRGSKSGFTNSTNYSVTTTGNWTRRDIEMNQTYTFLLTVEDISTNAAISDVTVITNNGDNTTTDLFGQKSFTMNYTAFVVSVGKEGYYSRTVSYIVDRDRSETIHMTAIPEEVQPQTMTYYTPWQVRIRIADFYGNPLPGTNVTANYIASTLPSTDTSWLVTAYGVNAATAAEMVDSGVAMTGVTDSNGGLSFSMFKSIQYSLLITNTTSGVSATRNLYPSDQEYLIRVPITGQTAVNNTLSQMANTSLPIYQLNSTAYNLSVIYRDTSGLTNDVIFYVKFRNGTVLYSVDLGNPGTGTVSKNYTINNMPMGTELLWSYSARRSGT